MFPVVKEENAEGLIRGTSHGLLRFAHLTTPTNLFFSFLCALFLNVVSAEEDWLRDRMVHQ
jgi:hypothetical protein